MPKKKDFIILNNLLSNSGCYCNLDASYGPYLKIEDAEKAINDRTYTEQQKIEMLGFTVGVYTYVDDDPTKSKTGVEEYVYERVESDGTITYKLIKKAVKADKTIIGAIKSITSGTRTLYPVQDNLLDLTGVDDQFNTLSAAIGTKQEKLGVNPSGEATETLSKLQIDDTIYDFAGGGGVASVNGATGAVTLFNNIQVGEAPGAYVGPANVPVYLTMTPESNQIKVSYHTINLAGAMNQHTTQHDDLALPCAAVNKAGLVPGFTTGDGGKVLKVKTDASGLEWGAGGGGTTYTAGDGIIINTSNEISVKQAASNDPTATGAGFLKAPTGWPAYDTTGGATGPQDWTIVVHYDNDTATPYIKWIKDVVTA